MNKFVERYGFNSKKHLGIINFAFDFLPMEFEKQYGVADCHIDMLRTVLEDKPDWHKTNRLYCFAAFRDSAKTSWFGVALPVYFACMAGNIFWDNYQLPIMNYMVIKGKTQGAAERTMQRIRQALNSEKILNTFGALLPSAKETRLKQGTDRQNMVITKSKIAIECLGVGNPIRGANIFGRIKYIVYDDVESEDNTLTEESRDKTNQDLFGSTLGAVDSHKGRLVYIANMVHQDCTLASLLKQKEWKRRKYALSYTGPDGLERSTWPKRFPLPLIHDLKRVYEGNPKKGLRVFYQEYYNKITSDITPVFIRDTSWRYVRHNNTNFITNGHEYRNIYVTLGYDPAQSEKSRTSDSAIAILGMDTDGRKYIIDYFLGKLDLHDKYETAATPVYPFALSDTDLKDVYKKGGIEEVCRMVVKYHVDAFCVETASQQRGIFNDIRERLDRTTPDFLASKKRQGYSLRTVIGDTYTPHIDKVQKLSASVMRDFEAGLYTCITDKYEIENIVSMFPSSKLDLLDAVFLADLKLVQPGEETYEFFGKKQVKANQFIPNIKSEEAWIVQ